MVRCACHCSSNSKQTSGQGDRRPATTAKWTYMSESLVLPNGSNSKELKPSRMENWRSCLCIRFNSCRSLKCSLQFCQAFQAVCAMHIVCYSKRSSTVLQQLRPSVAQVHPGWYVGHACVPCMPRARASQAQNRERPQSTGGHTA